MLDKYYTICLIACKAKTEGFLEKRAIQAEWGKAEKVKVESPKPKLKAENFGDLGAV
jgi:hypothetical protein